MQDQTQICNPYENLYRSCNFKSGQFSTRLQAQSIARHLGFLYNTFGLVVKDFINIVKFRFPENQANKSEAIPDPMVEELSQRQVEKQKQEKQENQVPNLKWREQYTLIQQRTDVLQKASRENNINIEHKKVIKYKNNSSISQDRHGTIDQLQQKRKQLDQIEDSYNRFNPFAFEYRPEKPKPSQTKMDAEQPGSQQIEQKTQTKIMMKGNVIDLEDD